MDATGSALFGHIKARLEWLNQRQRVLAEAVANADTPGYRPHDLTPFQFKDVMAAERLATTDPGHRAGNAGAQGSREALSKRTYEVAPAGNAVVLEEQMAKINETTMAHNLTTQLYRKYLGLLKTAVSAKG